MSNILCAPVKKSLVEKYGRQNVSVKSGTGTARNWVEVKINIEGQGDLEAERKIEKEALVIARNTLATQNLSFSTYGDDRECVMISVFFVEPKTQGIPMANMRDFDKAFGF